jgi:DNA-directed RNA polymerase specialized sigma24 family protein
VASLPSAPDEARTRGLPARRDAATSYFDDRNERLERVLATLPVEMREVLVLRKMEVHSSIEAADRRGKSDLAVRELDSCPPARLSTRLDAEEPDR